MSKSSRRKERDFKKLLGTFREMILSDKADLLHVEKVHLALRGREEKKKKKIDIQKSQQHLFKKKVEAKNDQKTDFLRAVHNLHRKKKYSQVSFSALLAC